MSPCSSRVVLHHLDERGPVEVTSLAAALDEHPMTVTKRCYDLQSEGHVRQISGGVYAITDDGQEYLEQLSE